MLYMVRCILEMKTPLHCGTKSDGGSTPHANTDAFGFWRIPGTAMSGILRRWLRTYQGEKLERELFGDEVRHSIVSVSDGVLLDYDSQPASKKSLTGAKTQIPIKTYLRDRIQIDYETGTVAPGHKFNLEYVPAGTRFAVEIILNGWEQEPSKEAVDGFSHLIYALKSNQLHFGGYASCGYGSYTTVECQCRKLDLTDPKQMEQWMQLDDAPVFPKTFGQTWEPKDSKVLVKEDRISGTITLPFYSSYPILIAGGMPAGDVDADLCFATTTYYDYSKKEVQEHLVLPGSSLRGVIRHRAYQILQLMGCPDPMSELNELFGAIGSQTQVGRLSFFDAPLFVYDKQYADFNNCRVVQHVSIDRFTSEAVDAHIFNEAPLWHDKVLFALSVRLNSIKPSHAAILLHTILDLAEGTIRIGHGTKRGNGRVFLDRNQPIKCRLSWNGQELQGDNTAMAKQWLSKIAAVCKEKGYAVSV